MTDACVALGIIDPQWFLGAAAPSCRRKPRPPSGGSARRSGSTSREPRRRVYRLITAEMSNAVRAVTVERGRDPATFAMVAFGGALGIFGADIARQNGIRRVVVPAEAAVFSAFGLLGTDDVRALARSVTWAGGDADHVDAVLTELEHQAVGRLRAGRVPRRRHRGREAGRLQVRRSAVGAHPPDRRRRPVRQSDLEAARSQFPARYEAEYGPGTAWPVPVEMLAARLVARGRAEKYEPAAAARRRRRLLRGPHRLQADRPGGVRERVEAAGLRRHPAAPPAPPSTAGHRRASADHDPGPARLELTVDEHGNYLWRTGA